VHSSVRIIQSEHRSISSVLHALTYLADLARAGRPLPDAKVFRAMLQYLDLFAEHVHHPKEDAFLFARLRERTHDFDEALDRLQEDHSFGLAAIRALEQAFMRYEEGGKPFLEAFAREVEKYATFYREHMRAEEESILPFAQTILSEDDWRRIDEAFEKNDDPLASSQEVHQLEDLFRRIETLAPTPMGAQLEATP
jgi:hemerythrin-like domain-containing protein